MARSDDNRRGRDTQVIRVGGTPHPLTDLYYRLMAGSWAKLLGFIALIYLFVNVAFALAYMGDPDGVSNSHGGSLSDAFVFSVQTLSTIGYGNMYPQTGYANTVVLAEAVAGLLCTALSTGLVFAKFARPRARVIFSDTMTINTWDGVPVLAFRVANARGNEVVEASISVAVLLPETTSEGHTMRRLHDLKLRRAQTPLFAMTWLVMHDLTEGSPLHDLTREQMAEQRARFIVSFTGLDATFSQQVHSRKIYLAEDLRWGERFVDVLNSQSDGTIRFDLTKFHDTEPMPTEERERAAQ